jgi:hypothetical protein
LARFGNAQASAVQKLKERPVTGPLLRNKHRLDVILGQDPLGQANLIPR